MISCSIGSTILAVVDGNPGALPQLWLYRTDMANHGTCFTSLSTIRQEVGRASGALRLGCGTWRSLFRVVTVSFELGVYKLDDTS